MRRRFMNSGQVSDASIPFDINDYLTVEALEDNLQVTVVALEGTRCRYGIDGIGWEQADGTQSFSLLKGQTISFSAAYSIQRFAFDKKCNLLGNCMSILFADEAKGKTDISLFPRGFIGLFQDCNTIVSVSANFLPATTLGEGCYYNMFSGCTRLVKAPELPAPTLVDRCYEKMFYGCTNLNYIKMLAFYYTDPSSYLHNWVSGVSRTGTFVKNPNMDSLSIGDSGIPRGWTVQNATY